MTVLSKRLEHWEKIHTPDYVKSWIREGVTIPFTQIPDPCEFENPAYSKDEENFIDTKLTELLGKSFISKVTEKPYCVTPIRCTAKKNSTDKFRLINAWITVEAFL